MNLVYIDESGNTGTNLRDAQQPVFLLAAMILPETKWFSLEQKFFEVAERYLGRKLSYPFEIHAADLKAGREIFKDIPLKQCLSFRDEMLQLLLDNEIAIIYRRIIKAKFEAFCNENYGPGIKVDPYVMALPFVCMEVDHWLKRKGANELGLLIIDEQKENLEYVERSLRTLRLDSASNLKTTNIVEKGFFVDSAKSFAVQMIDLAAYYIRKYEESRLKLPVSDFDRQTFDKIKQLVSTGLGSRMEEILEWVRDNCLKQK
jgi:hypothetical protein